MGPARFSTPRDDLSYYRNGESPRIHTRHRIDRHLEAFDRLRAAGVLVDLDHHAAGFHIVFRSMFMRIR